MNLTSLRTALNLKYLFALLTQWVYNGFDKNKNERILRCLRQRLVKTVIGGNKCVRII